MPTEPDSHDLRGDLRAQVKEFLTTRRARITPAQAGLPTYPGDRRRVQGLRRSEVASLAGISPEYMTKLERGSVSGVSESVIDGLTHALQLDDVERSHLEDLLRTVASAGRAQRSRRRPARSRVRPTIEQLIASIHLTPAFVLSGHGDVLAANLLGRALFQPLYDDPARPVNTARFVFLDPRAGVYYRAYDKVADDTVAILRAEAGRDPHDRDLAELISELSTRSDDFRRRWAAHDVGVHTHGTKLFHHPVVGDLDLTFESLPLPGDPGQGLLTYQAAPGTTSHDALELLASWAATAHVHTRDTRDTHDTHDTHDTTDVHRAAVSALDEETP